MKDLTPLEILLGHASRTGPRPANEDFVAAAMPEGDERAAKGVLLAIADGVGGHAHGREAAEYSVRSLLADYFSTAHTWSVQKSLDTVLGAANRWLLAQSARTAETAGMATTLTALVLRGRRWHLAHVGDSRAYLWRDGALLRLSEDHTWPHPELSNVLRRALGLESRLLVDHDDGELALGDVFVLLTDGVWNTLGDEAIAALLARQAGQEKEREGGGRAAVGVVTPKPVTRGTEAQGRAGRENGVGVSEEAGACARVAEAGLDPQAAADALVEAALRAGGNDNASALVACVRALPADNLRDRLAAGRRLPLPPRLAEGDTLDGLRVEAVLHVSRLTVLYRVCRIEDSTAAIAACAAPTSPQAASTSPAASVPVGAPRGANAASIAPDHVADGTAAIAACAAPTSPQAASTSPPAPDPVGAPRGAIAAPIAPDHVADGTAAIAACAAPTSPQVASTSPRAPVPVGAPRGAIAASIGPDHVADGTAAIAACAAPTSPQAASTSPAASVPVGAPRGANAASISPDHVADGTAAIAACAAPTSPQVASTSPQSAPAPVGAPRGANAAPRWVLKTLLPAHEHDEDARRALVREEWLARRVPAQGFPQVTDWPARAHLYYLMSWHEGESLKALLARGERLRAHEVAELGARVLRLVGVLHRLGIVHRDIKPDNLHLGRDGVLRLLDLGVAASEAEDLREINNPGTPSYMAPELFAGTPANEASDLYACGVTLYELLTRKFPYGEVEPFQHPRFGEPVPPTRHRPDTPAWLEAVLLKACAREPAARFETAEEFRLALERGAWQPLAVPRRTPLLERRPTLALKLIALASLLLNVVLLFLLYRSLKS
ncbi:protein phosphatase 2C domain-containing protein [Thauera sp.]|nr:protein phosphatase 2C domain-containing protein [Thauera sp.]MBP6131659.1 protein phosphatase 2C domain-containing protein [Thauera sp.]MBP7047177.1 protein phosphatase 2C domain-containing protein [Thauera sp.]